MLPGKESVQNFSESPCSPYLRLRSIELALRRLIRHCIAVSPRIRAGDSIAVGRIDQHRRSATRNAVRGNLADIVPAIFEFLDGLVGNRRFDIQSIEAGVVGPERSEEVQGLNPRPFE